MPLTLLHTLSGHSDVVWCCAWSPSGRALATCGGDKQVRVWTLEADADASTPDASKFVCKQVLDGTHTRTVRWVSWSPSGKYLASAGFDGITAIWENQNGEFECVATLEGHENEVKCVSWSRDGNLLATCSRDKSVWIWAADADREFECLSVLNGHTQDVKVAKWHPTLESTLLSASYDNSIKVWTEEDDDWYCTSTLTHHTSTVWALAFEPKGERMASASDDKSIAIWTHADDAAAHSTSTDAAAPADANTTTSTRAGRGAWRLQGRLSDAHRRCIYTVDWSAEGVIASGGADDAICIFGPSSAVAAAPQADAAAAAVAANSGDVATSATATTPAAAAAAAAPAAADLNLSLLHTQQCAHTGDVNCVAWNPTTPSLLASVGDDSVVKIWRLT